MNDILVGYSPNDFFYAQASQIGIMPDEDTCAALDPHNTQWDISCNQFYFPNNGAECISKELCKNKEKVEWVEKEQMQHSGADERYLDTKTVYSSTIMNTINLSIGILFLSIAIFKYRT